MPEQTRHDILASLSAKAKTLLAELQQVQEEIRLLPEPSGWGPDLTPVYQGFDMDDENEVCSWPGCGAHHFDDGAPLMDFTVTCSPGEEGYSEVTQLLCMAHTEMMVKELLRLGFGSHNHHGTCTLSAEDTCGGYNKCPHPATYGAELVRPETSTAVTTDG